MTENTEAETTRANLANLTKIPPTEFEKHFHEWMERDDVARGLQAKLRCDLIKNFNKTNLGKQMMAHTMTGGSTYRLTLSPLILALNTLVAEFLYAQNCHFTLSVFCTEIPFRNTLPDFDSMRNFRFNEREINDIWEAVIGSAANKRCLDPAVLEEYETNPEKSLLLLLVKSLLDMKPLEMLRKSVEIQTETVANHQEKYQQSKQDQATQQTPVKTLERKSPDNLRHINKYLLILSQKVQEMTHEFELLVRQRNIRKPQPQQQTARKTSRSRELYTLNRSLDRINENVKQLARTKRKGKRLTNIVESIDGLTKQFGKCAESFGQVTRELNKREKKLSTPRVNFQEKQTETEATVKTYADWIQEMRTTDNGRKFLERVESSLNKAVAKRKEQWQNEMEDKLKNMRSLIKLHYKQKMLTHLSRQGSEERTDEARKLNESIEMKLKQFELKQLELVEKLRESSFELQEAQRHLEEQTQKSEVQEAQRDLQEQTQRSEVQEAQRDLQEQTQRSVELPLRDERTAKEIEKARELQKQHDQLVHEQMTGNEKPLGSPKPMVVQKQAVIEEDNTESLKPVDNTQKQLPEMVDIVTPRDPNLNRIIADAKLRLQQLETESHCLEQHFQIYLERRKKEYQNRLQNSERLIKHSQNKTSEIFRNFKQKSKAWKTIGGETHLPAPRLKSFATQDDLDLDFDVEFQRLQEKLKETQLQLEAKCKNPCSSSSPIEMTNAIREAKQRFFENEELFRKRKEKELMLNHNKELFEEYDSDENLASCDSFSYTPQPYPMNRRNVPSSVEREQIIVFNINSNIAKSRDPQLVTEPETLSPKPKSPTEQEYIQNSKMPDSRDSKNKSPPQETLSKVTKSAEEMAKPTEIVKYHEPLSIANGNLRQALKDLKTYTTNMTKKDSRTSKDTAELIKQSMEKMKQLFGEPSKDKKEDHKTEVSIINNVDEVHASPTLKECLETAIPNLQDINQTTSTTSISHTETTTTSTIASSLDGVPQTQLNVLNTLTSSLPHNLPLIASNAASTNRELEIFKSASAINRISNISMPPLMISDSDESSKSEHRENVASDTDDDGDIHSSIGEILSDGKMDKADRNPIPELLITPKVDSLEIGEILSEHPQAVQFAPLTEMSSSASSEDTDTESSIGLENRSNEKLAAKTSEGSESDFWA